MNRRTFVGTALTGVIGAATACDPKSTAPRIPRGPRLTARPHAPSTIATPGLHALGLSPVPDGRFFVPAGHTADEPLPLMVLLHGATGSSADWFGSYDDRGEAARYLMLAPDSRFVTWDALWGDYGVDVDFLDAALNSVFDRCAVDPDRIAIAGFSDGASYALGLGLGNGDLFRSVIAYAPGRMIPGAREGKPGIFVAHGTNDDILPIDSTSRRFVPELRELGYEVEYHEFDGTHQVPQGVSDLAFEWLADEWG